MKTKGYMYSVGCLWHTMYFQSSHLKISMYMYKIYIVFSFLFLFLERYLFSFLIFVVEIFFFFKIIHNLAELEFRQEEIHWHKTLNKYWNVIDIHVNEMLFIHLMFNQLTLTDCLLTMYVWHIDRLITMNHVIYMYVMYTCRSWVVVLECCQISQ